MTNPSDRDLDGYRRVPGAGPTIRSDIVDVYVFRRRDGDVEILQLHRVTEPMKGDWHPLMAHIEAGETAVDCAIRELSEEVGLDDSSSAWRGFWQLEQVHPYYLAEIDAIVLSARFAAEVDPDWRPQLNHEHDDHRWVAQSQVSSQFVWPGQKSACAEILSELIPEGSLSAGRLQIEIGSRQAGG